MYNRLINAPTSVVGHDDLEMYERAQEGLHVDANQWVNVQRLYTPDEKPDVTAETNGTTEWQMRNQFYAWSKFMTMSMEAQASAVIIAALPFAVMILVYISSPSYIELLWTHQTGRLMMACCAAWMSIGVFVMKKMINFDF